MEIEPVVIALSGPGFRHQLTIETIEDLALVDLILESIKTKIETSATLSEPTKEPAKEVTGEVDPQTAKIITAWREASAKQSDTSEVKP